MNSLKPIFVALTGVGLLFFGLSFGIESLESFRWYSLLLALVALSFIPESRVIRAAFGTATLAALVFFITQLVSSTSIGTRNLDLTEDSRYTLTEGTRAILSELSEPVTINYYVTRDVDGTPASLKRHIPRVDSFFKEIESLAKDDLITLNFIDPEPNTDEEDAALLDQVQQIPVTQDDKMIFGASISSLDKKTVIPVFDPQQETQLEFQVISAIAEVTTRKAPVVGLMSAHNMAVGGQSGRGWLFYQVLQRSYDLIDLGMTPTASLESAYEERKWGEAPDFLDPEKIPLILVVHPAGITPEAEFALDQYLLRGGTVIACVDPLSVVAMESQRQQQPQFPGMPPQGGISPSSSLPLLFKKHNVQFSDAQIAIDRTYATPRNPTELLITKEAMPVEDDISLASIQNLRFFAGGGFTGANNQPIGPGLESTRLVESSYKYTLIENQALSAPDGQQKLRFALGSRREDDRKLAYVTLLSGTFESAFPEGKPTAPTEEEADKDDEKEEKEKEVSSLTSGIARGNLYLIADSDFLYDSLSYAYQRLSRDQGFMQTVSGNGPFILNIIDQAVGSKYLIGARARTPLYRAFTLLKDKEAELEKASGENIEKFQAKANQAAQERQELRSQLTRENAAQLSPELLAKEAELLKIVADANKSIRMEQKSYQSEVDSLKAGIFWKSILIMPLVVTVIGLIVYLFRRSQTNAR